MSTLPSSGRERIGPNKSNQAPASEREVDFVQEGQSQLPAEMQTAPVVAAETPWFSRPAAAGVALVAVLGLGAWLISTQESVPVPEPEPERTVDERFDDLERAQATYRELNSLGIAETIAYRFANGVALVDLRTGEIGDVERIFPNEGPNFEEELDALLSEESAEREASVSYDAEWPPALVEAMEVVVSPDRRWALLQDQVGDVSLFDFDSGTSVGVGANMLGDVLWSEDSSFVGWLEPDDITPQLRLVFTDDRPRRTIDIASIGGPDRAGPRFVLVEQIGS